jgi:hypothetical protein
MFYRIGRVSGSVLVLDRGAALVAEAKRETAALVMAAPADVYERVG